MNKFSLFFIIFLLVINFLFLFLFLNERIKIKELENEISYTLVIEEIDKKLNKILEKDTDLYVKLNSEILRIKKEIKDLKIKNEISKEEILLDNKNLNINILREKFKQRGYSSIIIDLKK